MKSTSCKIIIAALPAVLLLLSGCRSAGTMPTSDREVHEVLPFRVVDGPSVKELLEVCDYFSRDLANSPIVEQAEDPVVLEIDPALLEDRTGQGLDTRIYAEIIREVLLGTPDSRIAIREPHYYDEAVGDRMAAAAVGNTARFEQLESRISQLAQVDYLLQGFIYRQDEVTRQQSGFRYYRIQLRLSDPNTGLIRWEKHYHFKTAVDS